MAFKTRFKVDTIRTLAAASIGANYAAIGSALSYPARIFCLNNLTDANLYFSIDGVNDHFIVPAYGNKMIYAAANKVHNDGFFVPKGTVFSVKQVVGAPQAGSVYIEIIHA